MSCKACLCCVGFFLMMILVLISVPFLFLKDRRPHVLLRKVGNYLERLDNFEQRVERTISEDPFKDLFDNKVRPTLEALSSIKKQVAIYEKMERMHGGPTNFIQTALKVVDETDKKIFLYEAEYQSIVSKSLKANTKLQNEFEDLHTEGSSVIDEKDTEIWNGLGLLLVEDKHSEIWYGLGIEMDGNRDFVMKPISDEFTIPELLHELADLLEKQAEIEERLKVIIRELNILKVDEVEGTRAEPVAVELTHITYQVKELLLLAGPSLVTVTSNFDKYFKAIRKLVTDSADQLDRSKTRYEKIVDVLDEDNKAVRKRILDLKVYRKKDEF